MDILWFMLFGTLCPLFSITTTTNGELINSLPGQLKRVTFKQYSGYIVTDDSHGRSLFYYFAEAHSKPPLTAPLTLWFGGAHTCSSVGNALFSENGPFRLRKDGKLINNEFSWNLESNMLYVDSPIGTGFSFTNVSSDYSIWNNALTANDTMKFIIKWFVKFPKYRELDFYMAGDGYGGCLLPQLAVLVLEYNTKHATPIKLKGLALGNPGMGTPGVDHDDYLWYHGIISKELHTMLKTVCTPAQIFYEAHHGNMSKDCKKMEYLMKGELGEDFDVQSVLLPSCTSSNLLASETTIADPCIYDYITDYLNKPDVQKALHASYTHLPYPWDTCVGPRTKHMKGGYTIKNVHTLSTLLKRHIPILLYSGDQGFATPVVETRKLANMLAKELKLITLQKNRPWYNGFQVGGWSEAFGKLRKGNNVTYLTFASVKGGSHFVPFTSPSEALTLFKAFLAGSSPPISKSN